MNPGKLLAVLGVVLVGIICKVSGECEDSLKGKTTILILNSDKKIIGKARSCKQLVKKWPHMCDKSLNGTVIGAEGGRCCQSCQSVDTSCLDSLTKQNNYQLGGKKIKSCKVLVKKYPGLCAKEGLEGGKCCQACKGVDLSCVDNPLTRFTDAALTCEKYIKQDKCRCVDHADKCCKSCENVDTDALGCSCRDLLSASNPAKITITDPTNNDAVVVSKDVDNCKEIVEYYAQFCKNLGGEDGACCKSCDGVDSSCSDNLLWRGSISHRGETCNDCTCHDIRNVSARLMKKACKDNIKRDGGGHRIQTACCLQCSRVGVTGE